MRASRDEVRAEQLTAYRQVSGCKGKHILGITQRPIVHILYFYSNLFSAAISVCVSSS